jgi:hypothetical protein
MKKTLLIISLFAILGQLPAQVLTGNTSKKFTVGFDLFSDIWMEKPADMKIRAINQGFNVFGTFLLKSFFSEAMQTDSGEEVSTREIKKILRNCIEAEEKNKPLTDEQLTDILKEKGYNIARRTVAKYREQLDIPVARLRKEL